MSIRAGIVWRSRSELRRVADIHQAIARHIADGDAAGAGQQMTRHFEDARVGLMAPERVFPSKTPGKPRGKTSQP
jgi:DNA-binding GntR family transcriptional regulator